MPGALEIGIGLADLPVITCQFDIVLVTRKNIMQPLLGSNAQRKKREQYPCDKSLYEPVAMQFCVVARKARDLKNKIAVRID